MKVCQNQQQSASEVSLSIIIPVFNERDGLLELISRLDQVITGLSLSTELVFIDDGSTDGTWEALQLLPAASFEYQCIRLSRNFGKEAATTAGLEQARGLAVILLDADLQDPPELIPEMIAAWREGADVVNMRRRSRAGESWLKRFSAAAFYRVINGMSQTDIPQNVGDFRLLSRQVVDAINALPERNRFMKGLLSWPGFNQVTLTFDRDPRFVGTSKWGYGKLLGLAMDGITSFSIKPLRIATWLGLLTAMAAFGYGSWVFAKTVIWGEVVAGYPSLMVVQLGVAGIELLALGLIGEYLGRVFMEVKQRPVYLIGDVQYRQSQQQGQTQQIDKAASQADNIRYLKAKS
ncbi:glycosyltransferase family 2 protein [Shewanella waksmanii]|uniref:glycosyltransferase family 2 protein n=1 Tax=Shewanella waksmanii TaxID=213783 RepID=UPI003735F61E